MRLLLLLLLLLLGCAHKSKSHPTVHFVNVRSEDGKMTCYHPVVLVDKSGDQTYQCR